MTNRTLTIASIVVSLLTLALIAVNFAVQG